MSSGLVGLHLKDVELFIISRNWPSQGGTVSPGSARPQDTQAPKIQNKNT